MVNLTKVNFKQCFILLCLLGEVLFGSSSVHAATFNKNSEGELIGASNVYVHGISYDVEFLDGSFRDLFAKSNQYTIFPSSYEAMEAALALLDQVFINHGGNTFDDSTALTYGCLNLIRCDTLIPYGPIVGGLISQIVVRNISELYSSDPDNIYIDQWSIDRESLSGNITYSRWSIASPVSTVPEASGSAMLFFGLIVLMLFNLKNKQAR